MSTERDGKEGKAMPTANDVRRAHYLLDHLGSRTPLSNEHKELLRSFLPELPKQKALAELAHDVYDAWAGTEGNDWPDDTHGDLDAWLREQYTQLKGLIDSEPAHPKFLETEADYAVALDGTIVAADKVGTAWIKTSEAWHSTDGDRSVECPILPVGTRRILRWGWGNE